MGIAVDSLRAKRDKIIDLCNIADLFVISLQLLPGYLQENHIFLWITFQKRSTLVDPVSQSIANLGKCMSLSVWDSCLEYLEKELPNQEFYTWIRPLQAHHTQDSLTLYAPNRFVLNWVKDNFLGKITQVIDFLTNGEVPTIRLEIGTHVILQPSATEAGGATSAGSEMTFDRQLSANAALKQTFQTNLNKSFSFDNFVVGKSNQLAIAAGKQVANEPGGTNNPLLIYGGVGLGKTHLMQAAGNLMIKNNPNAKVLYIHSERFVARMVKSLQSNRMDEFKQYYRQLDALLIDDIQFFAGKGRSQEEFFHTFNALLEAGQQIIITCDRYPKEISGLEERLKSRFGWGLTVAVEPPELETRVAILMSKAEQVGVALQYEEAFFIAKRIRSNVRELEGALKRVIANAKFTGHSITIEFIKESLKDLLYLQDKLVTIDNIIKTVAEYYKVKVAELLSKKRNRSIARPRQMAMRLAKELTNHSLPEIGDAFGGRDHTTVLHGCRKMNELIGIDIDLTEDYKNLIRILTT